MELASVGWVAESWQWLAVDCMSQRERQCISTARLSLLRHGFTACRTQLCSTTCTVEE